MTDIAELAFRVDTRDLERADQLLNKLGRSGDAAEKNLEAVGDTAQAAEQ